MEADRVKFLLRHYPLVKSQADNLLDIDDQSDYANSKFQNELRNLVEAAFEFSNMVPRYHQLDTVFEIIMDLLRSVSKVEIPNQNYLVQHSAGSGKSLTIAGLVFMLHHLKINHKPMYHKIIVVNDRKLLDIQLGNTLNFFFRYMGPNSIVQIDTCNDLKNAIESLNGANRVIVTTVQMFQKISELSNFKCSEKIAIVADEAHRYHGRKLSNYMHMLLGKNAYQSSNINYFSFTSTPSITSLEMFGTIKEYSLDSLYEPFYTYSINQCILDGIILDPLLNYFCIGTDALSPDSIPTCLKLKTTSTNYTDSRVVVETETESDSDDEPPEPQQKKRRIQLDSQIASNNIIEKKSIYIVRHLRIIFKENSNPDYNPKAMLIVKSRLDILVYKLYIEREINKLGADEKFRVICGFSNFKHQDRMMSEEDRCINPYFSESIESTFRRWSDIRLLICADKFQTGFDEPSLHTLYIDKVMHGANAVQIVSRVNRKAKGKNTTCIVDFVNSFESVQKAFDKYSGKTCCPVLLKEPNAKIIRQIEHKMELLMRIKYLKEKDFSKCTIYISIMNYLIHLICPISGTVNQDLRNKYSFETMVNDCIILMKNFKPNPYMDFYSTILQLRVKLSNYKKTIGISHELSRNIQLFWNDIIQNLTRIEDLPQDIELWRCILTDILDNTTDNSFYSIFDKSNLIFRNKMLEMKKLDFSISHDESMAFAKNIWKTPRDQVRAPPQVESPSPKDIPEEVIDAIAREIATEGPDYECGVKLRFADDPQFQFLKAEHKQHVTYLKFLTKYSAQQKKNSLAVKGSDLKK